MLRRLTPPLPGTTWPQCIVLGCAMALVTSSFGLLQPFSAPYLRAAGLSTWDVNLVSGIALLSGMLVQPLLGRLSDRLDARRPAMILMGILAAIAYGLFPFVSGIWQFLLLTTIGLNGFHYLNTVGGVIIGRIAGPAAGGAAYSRFRVFGSIGYVIVAKVSGWLLPSHAGMTTADLRPVFVFGPLFFVAIAILASWVPDPKSGTVIHDVAPAGASPQSSPMLSKAKPLPRLIPMFLIAYAFYQGPLYGVSANLPLYLTEKLHATASDLGTFFAFGVVAEVLVMFQVGKYTDRYGRRPALLLAFALLPVRLVGYILAPTPFWAAVVQSLHGLNFGIVGAIAIAYINDCAEDHRRGTEQARLGVTASVATAISQWLCGWIIQRFGFPMMFYVMSTVATFGAIWMFLLVDESHPAFRGSRALLNRRRLRDAG